MTYFESLEQRALLSVPTVNFDGGDSFRRSANLGRLSGSLNVNDSVVASEQADYFQFTVRTKGNVNVSLNGLSSNADLRLYDAYGKTLASSSRSGASSENVGRTLKKGTYVVAVLRGKSGEDTSYTLSLQADSNYETVDVDGDDFTLSLMPVDGSSTAISSKRETWITAHGWLGSPKSMRPLGAAIDAASKRNQVLELDWSGPASDLNPLTVLDRIPDIGKWVARKLASWGIPGSQVNLAGFSYGGDVVDQIARRVSGGVDRIVAIDPATKALGPFDLSDTDYAKHSKFSLALVGSGSASEVAAETADETILTNVGAWSSLITHGNVLSLFTAMTIKNDSGHPDRVSRAFSLSTLHSGMRPDFTTDAYSDRYEAVIQGDALGPDSMTYVSRNARGEVTIKA